MFCEIRNHTWGRVRSCDVCAKHLARRAFVGYVRSYQSSQRVTPASLKAILVSVLAQPQNGRDVSLLVRHAYQQALVRVRQLHNSGRLHLQQHSLSLESLAFDCIAELFARDDTDAFHELQDGFSGPWSLSELDDVSAAARFRSLVFTHLHQGLIRTYKELDPVFSKILRNIRLALRAMPDVEVYERLGMRYVSPVPAGHRCEERPDLSFQVLQQFAGTLPSGAFVIREFLRRVLDVIAEQTEYRRACALFDLTLVLKHRIVRERVPLESIATEEHSVLGMDISTIVEEQMQVLRARWYRDYVSSGKLTEERYANYSKALNDLITDLFVLNNGQDLAHPDYLTPYMPGLSRESYRRDHRATFEYMVKVARKTIGATLQELFG